MFVGKARAHTRVENIKVALPYPQTLDLESLLEKYVTYVIKSIITLAIGIKNDHKFLLRSLIISISD